MLAALTFFGVLGISAAHKSTMRMDGRKDMGTVTPFPNFTVVYCAWAPQLNPSIKWVKLGDNEKQVNGSLNKRTRKWVITSGKLLMLCSLKSVSRQENDQKLDLDLWGRPPAVFSRKKSHCTENELGILPKKKIFLCNPEGKKYDASLIDDPTESLSFGTFF